MLAIIEPYLGKAWLNIVNSPMLLGRACGLQAVDVNVLLAPAGRIAVVPGSKYVAFETADGGTMPDLVDDTVVEDLP
jgi:hypothetical protein